MPCPHPSAVFGPHAVSKRRDEGMDRPSVEATLCAPLRRADPNPWPFFCSGHTLKVGGRVKLLAVSGRAAQRRAIAPRCTRCGRAALATDQGAKNLMKIAFCGLSFPDMTGKACSWKLSVVRRLAWTLCESRQQGAQSALDAAEALRVERFGEPMRWRCVAGVW